MPDRPNLDYEPCPEGVSYSRVGPPTEQQPRPASGSTRYELATEIGLPAAGTAPKTVTAAARRPRGTKAK